MTRVLVTGASGALGPAVVRALADAGFDVTAWIRRADAAAMFASGVRVVIGDLQDEATLHDAIAGARGIVHLAAELHRNEISAELNDEYWRVNVHATRRLIDAAVSGGVDRIVFASTIVVYEDSRAPLTEDSPTAPSTLYADTKLHAEREILSARNHAGAPLGTVMRLAAVYGPGVKGNYRSLVKTLDRGWFVPIGPGLNRRALIYVDDAAAAMVAAMRTPEAAGRIYNLSDGVGHRLTDIIAAISQALGRRPPRFSLPLPLVRAGVGLASTVGAVLKVRLPITRATLDKYTEDIFVDNGRARRELQFTPAMTLSAGWQATIDGMRADGTLPSRKRS